MRSILLTFLLAFTLAGGLRAGEVPDPLGAWTLVDYGATNPVLHCMPLGACLVALDGGCSPDAVGFELLRIISELHRVERTVMIHRA